MLFAAYLLNGSPPDQTRQPTEQSDTAAARTDVNNEVEIIRTRLWLLNAQEYI